MIRGTAEVQPRGHKTTSCGDGAQLCPELIITVVWYSLRRVLGQFIQLSTI
jgi:hypothetical protein